MLKFFQKKDAHISSFLAIVLASLFFLQVSFSYLLGKQLFERLLLKGTEMQVSYALSHYHLPLKKRFSLLALKDLPKKDYLPLFVKELEKPAFYPRPTIDTEYSLIDFWEEDENILLDQIKYITGLRLAGKMVRFFQEKHEEGKKMSKKFLEGKEVLKKANQTLEKVETSLEDLEETEDEEKNFFKQILLDLLQEARKAFAFTMEDLSFNEDIFQNAVEKGLSALSDFENTYAEFQRKTEIFDKVLLLQYILHHFAFQTAPFSSEVKEDFYASLLSGIPRKELSPTGTHEVEAIFLGLEEKEAFQRCKQYLLLFRFLAHFTGVYQSGLDKQYVPFAQLLSTALYVLTAGSVYVPPEAFVLVLVSIDALKEAKKDVEKLIEGKGVAWIPHVLKEEIFYSQCLFFMGLFQSKEKLLKMTREKIEKIFSSKFAQGVKAEIYYEDVSGAYQYIHQASFFEAKKEK